MKELKANILSADVTNVADAICFTSNGVIKNNGRAVMGAGIAKTFRDRFKDLDVSLAASLRQHGNIPNILTQFFIPPVAKRVIAVVNFPTKHHWKDKSDINLIVWSAIELKKLADENCWSNIYLTRPGCSLGGLNWEKEVKPAIQIVLDDRFTVCYL